MRENPEKVVAQIDIDNLASIRDSVREFTAYCAAKFDEDGKLLLDIAPQVHESMSKNFILPIRLCGLALKKY